MSESVQSTLQYAPRMVIWEATSSGPIKQLCNKAMRGICNKSASKCISTRFVSEQLREKVK